MSRWPLFKAWWFLEVSSPNNLQYPVKFAVKKANKNDDDDDDDESYLPTWDVKSSKKHVLAVHCF